MRIAYFDCFSGISGDMILGALIDAGLNADVLVRELKKINLEPTKYEINVAKIQKIFMQGTHVDVIEKEFSTLNHHTLSNHNQQYKHVEIHADLSKGT